MFSECLCLYLTFVTRSPRTGYSVWPVLTCNQIQADGVVKTTVKKKVTVEAAVTELATLAFDPVTGETLAPVIVKPEQILTKRDDGIDSMIRVAWASYQSSKAAASSAAKVAEAAGLAPTQLRIPSQRSSLAPRSIAHGKRDMAATVTNDGVTRTTTTMHVTSTIARCPHTTIVVVMTTVTQRPPESTVFALATETSLRTTISTYLPVTKTDRMEDLAFTTVDAELATTVWREGPAVTITVPCEPCATGAPIRAGKCRLSPSSSSTLHLTHRKPANTNANSAISAISNPARKRSKDLCPQTCTRVLGKLAEMPATATQNATSTTSSPRTRPMADSAVCSKG